ncbi:MAG: hypothetical protein JRI68_16600 [Deltaproteobacteria bacterium]|nr:hypothetical protein [Deltaproteobacteria bacterium]
MGSSGTLLGAGLVALATLGCAGTRSEPASGEPSVEAEGTRAFSLEPQRVGTAADGLSLRSIRHAAHDGFYRLVFDIAMAEGKLATTIPATAATYRERDRSIELTIAGIRHDLTGNLPLQSEAGDSLGKPVTVNRPPVSHFARELSLDDSLVAYRIQLTREARFRLQGLDQPARIVLDVEETGGARPQ